jgi:serine/threonine protein kinase
MLSARRLQAQATIKIIQEEAKNLKSLVHQHIITLLGSYEETKPRNRHSYYLLMSPVGENDLRNFLEMVGDENETRSQTAALSIWKTWIYGWFACLASALAFMHGNGIRHQDIKPSNIIHKGQDIYFTDFSSSCAFDIGHTTSTDNPSRASPMYAAPEIIENYTGNLQRHGRATDIFALGCVFCDMLSVLTGGSVSMFQGAIRDPEAINFGRGALYYSQRLSQISEWFTSSAIFSDHICAMLQHSRDLRPTAMAVVQWFVIDNIFNDTCTCWQHSLWCADSEGQMSRRKVEAVQVRNKQNVFVPLKYATDDDIAHIERHGIHSDPWTTRRL